MLFSKELDKTLYIILITDNIKRHQIINLIVDMNEDLLNKIKTYYQQKEINKSAKYSYAKREENITSIYRIELSKAKLKISLNKWNELVQSNEDNYQLELNIIDLDNPNEEDLFNGLGKYQYGINRTIFPQLGFTRYNSINYDIIEITDQEIKINLLDDFRNKIETINIKDINKEDFKTKKNIKKILKRKE